VGLDAFYEHFKNQNETPDGDDEVVIGLYERGSDTLPLFL
jgi:hypothetical protein